MRKKQRCTTDEIYICSVCGYESRYRRDIQICEIGHGQNVPFKIGDNVRWNKSIDSYDHGNTYTYECETAGTIIFLKKDPGVSYMEQAMVETEDMCREWIFVSSLKNGER